MTSRFGLAILGLISALCATAATAQDQTARQANLARNLPQFAFKYEQSCHQTQAVKLKSLPKGASEIERMQIEITDRDVCPCIARKIIELKDQDLAERILAEEDDVQSQFFEPAFQQCSVAVLRKTALLACKDDVSPGTLKADAIEEACRCYSDAVASMDDTSIRDDAIAAYRNYEARVKDPTVKLYASKLESMKTACVAKQKSPASAPGR